MACLLGNNVYIRFIAIELYFSPLSKKDLLNVKQYYDMLDHLGI